MDATEFAISCKRERDMMFEEYANPQRETAVGQYLDAAKLSTVQREHVMKALNQALTDSFCTMLMALDGAASLGGNQQSYRIFDENGDTVSSGTGGLEAAAFLAFQSN